MKNIRWDHVLFWMLAVLIGLNTIFAVFAGNWSAFCGWLTAFLWYVDPRKPLSR